MKKYFLSIVALAGMLFATSCQESLVEPQVGGPTTFTIEIPGQMGTKAVSDVINRLYVEVYSADGSTLVYRPDFYAMADGKATVTLNLVANQECGLFRGAPRKRVDHIPCAAEIRRRTGEGYPGRKPNLWH